MSPAIIAILVTLVLLAVVGGGVVVARRRRALPPAPEQRKLPEARPAPPSKDVVRETLDRPVEDTEGMSLRDLKQARGARLSDDYKASDDARQAKDFRKGAQEAPVRSGTSDEAAPVVSTPTPTPVSTPTVEPPAVPPVVAETPASVSSGLERTRSGGFIGRLSKLFVGRDTLDEAMIEEIEEVLFTADIGASTSAHLLDVIREAIGRGTASVDDVWALLRAECTAILESAQGELVIGDARPFVVLVVGVNGVGKTTTIGKLAARYQREGKRVLVVAGDTFRAAAVQQLEEWAHRVGCGVHTGADESDPSGVIFDGIRRAQEEGYDVVLADTAGRLHTKAPLVDELKKIVRVASKAMDGAPHETVLVLDSNTGQNAIQQARLFNDAVSLTGLVLTKLDGTAKGGIVLGITRELQLPVYYIGIGEGIRDLRTFRVNEFVDALF